MLIAYALEPRILFDGAAAATAADTADAGPTEQTVADNGAALDQHSEQILAAFSNLPETPPGETDSEAIGGLFVVGNQQNLSLTEAKQAAEQSLRDFAQNSDAEQWFELFNGGENQPSDEWLQTQETLRQEILDWQYNVQIELLDNTTLQGAKGAFSATGTNGQATIYLNADWLAGNGGEIAGADSASISTVLIEELGHYLDAKLNPGGDTVGDEGERFSRFLNQGENPLTLSYLSHQDDHATLQIDGQHVEVEFASFNFVNAYEMVYDLDNNSTVDGSGNITGGIDVNERWAAKEQNSHYFKTGGLGVAVIDDNTNSKYFSGNDVSAIGLNIGGIEYFGWVSRPIKAGGVVRGFYFWTDDDFGDLATAQADGNQDGDSNVMDNRGFLLVVDQAWFTQQIVTNTPYTINNAKDGNLGPILVANIGSSSDRVDSALNALVDSNNAPVANADTANGSNGTTAAVEAGYGVVTVNGSGNVLSNDTDANSDALVVSQLSTNNKSSTVSVTSNTPGAVTGQYGTLTLQANGTYSYVVNNANSTVDALQSGQTLNDAFVYTISDGKGGTASATLTIVINGSNDAPTANPDYNTAKESITGYTGYSATGDVTVNDTDVDDNETTKYIDGITVSGGASVATVSVASGTATLFFSGDSGFTANLSGRALYVNIAGTYRAVYDASNNQVTLASKVDQGSNNWLITLNATPATYDSNGSAGGDTAIGNLGTFFTTNSSVGFEASTTPTENTSGMKTATVGTASTTGYTTLSNLSSLSGTIAVGMTVTSTDNSGVPVGTKINELTYTSGVLTSIKLDKELTSTTIGNFTFTTSATVGNTIQGAHGSLVLNTDGSYTYTPTTNNPYLSSGESAVEAFDYSMRDHVGGVTSSSTLYITVYGTGSNDPLPTNDTGSATEAGVSTGSPATGNVLGNDKQTAAAGTAGTNVVVTSAGLSGGSTTAIGSGETKTINGLYGDLQLSSVGVYTYTVNDALATVNALAAGQSLTEVFNYRVANTASPTSQTWATLTVTLNGANDAPVTVVDTASVLEDSGVVPTGNLLGNDSDVDNGDSLTVANMIAGTDTNTFGAGNAVTAGTTSTSSPRTVTGSYGTLYVGADGSYRYVLDSNNATVQALTPSSPAITDVFTYRAIDTAGGSNTATLTVSITGANETPINQFNGVAISSTSSTSVTTALNTAIDFTGSKLLAVGDADSNLDSITLEVEHGTLSFTSAPSGVSLSAASGGSITISAGSQTDLLAALALLRYTPDTGFYGTDFLSINSSDSVSARDIDGVAINIPTITTATVKESALSGGSNASSNDETYSGNVTLGSGQSIVSLQTGNILDGSNIVIGTWQVNINSSFSVTLTAASSATSTSFSFAVIDVSGNTVNNTVNVTIEDDGPTATANTKSVNEGATAIGSVLNDGTVDAFGGDGAKTTSPVGGVIGFRTGSDTSTPATANIGTEVTGTYGKLTLNADGSYSYVANPNSVITPQTDSFVYTIEDADGTRSTATLTITVNDAATDTIAVTGYGPVNEASQYAMFTVVASGSQTLDLVVTNGDTSLSSPAIEYSTDGTNWTTYDSGHKPTGGTFFVRVTITSEADNDYEDAESFSLVATNSSNNAITDSASTSIIDDNTGSKYDGTLSASIPGSSTTGLDDDRSLSVTGYGPVNEGSTYAMFTVTALEGYALDLTLQAASSGTAATRTGFTFEYSTDGTTWTTYTWNGSAGNQPTVPASGKVYVRVDITSEADSNFEGAETFALKAEYTSNTAKSASADTSIIDDNTGSKYDGTLSAGNPVSNTTSLDDDRSLSVTGYGPVNEGSTYAMFTVTALEGYALDLTLQAASSGTAATRTGFTYEYSTDGTSWTTYTWNGSTGNQPTVPAGGKVYVRVNITSEADTTFEGSETFALKASYSSNTAKSATADTSIVDEGSGKKYGPDVTAGTPNESTTDLDDDRTLSVTGYGPVNEGSTYAMFNVTALEGYALDLTLQAASSGTAATRTGFTYEYSTDGTSWTTYTWNGSTGNQPTVPASGKVYVRVDITSEADSNFEGAETFALKANYTSNVSKSATADAGIVDDGSGTKYDGTLTTGTPIFDTTNLDDDRQLTVNDIRVNEGSPYAVFTVTGIEGQQVKLSLSSGTATLEDGNVPIKTDGSEDFGPALQYWNGSAWTNYTTNSFISIPTDGDGNAGETAKLLVRTTINPDALDEGDHTFTLTVENSNGNTSNGIATIDDHGGGVKYPDVAPTNPTSTSPVPFTDNSNLDDDRPRNEDDVNVTQIVDFNASPTGIEQATTESNIYNSPTTGAGDANRPEDFSWQYGLISWPGIHISGDRDMYQQVWGEVRSELMEATIDLGVDQGGFFKLPPEALMGLDTGDSLRFDASLTNGEQLPEWIKFDPNNGSLSISENAPLLKEAVKVKVVATDTKGNQVTVTIILKAKVVAKMPINKPKVNTPPKLSEWVGKQSLSEQISMSDGRHSIQQVANHLLAAAEQVFGQSGHS